MARRINAPGIEVNEIDRSSYNETVDNSTIGTATLVMGFADRGDDYNVKWINSLNTFNQVYGTPKTDAEKYFYNSVYEVLNNGGVCYTSKLPYYNESLDNFTYTSYTISPSATYVYSPVEILEMIKLEEYDSFYLSDYINLQPSISSMCEAIKNSISVINQYSLSSEIQDKTQLSSGFTNYLSNTIEDMAEAIHQLGEVIKHDESEKTILLEYYSSLQDSLNTNIIITQNSINLKEFIFYPYLENSIKEILFDSDYDFELRQMDDFIKYLKDNCNFSIYEQNILDEYVLSSDTNRRAATLEINKIINGESLLYQDSQISSYIENIKTNIFQTFGENSVQTIVDSFCKTVYLEDFKIYLSEMIEKLSKYTVLPYDFSKYKNLLNSKYTEMRIVDNSLTSYVSISSDISGTNEIINYSNYDKFLIKELKVPLNKIYIVDKSRGIYSKDTFGNEVVGLMPVIVTPANALFYQELIEKRDDILSDYNLISKVRNTYRKYGTTINDDTYIPFDQTNLELSSYNIDDFTLKNKTKEFIGLADYLGSEVFSDGSRVTVNDYTVSQFASEHFPTLKFISDRLDRQYLNQIGIVVFKLYKDSANDDRISFSPIESFVGSLDRNAKDQDSGNNIFIDDVVNNSSNYINVFSNANIKQSKDINPLGLKNASIYLTNNQTACSMGFFERDTRKNIHVNKSIYQPILNILDRNSDKNTLDIDIIVDGGVSNIAQFIASTQAYELDPVTDKKTNRFIKNEFDRYGKFDFNDDSAYLFKLDNPKQCNVWKKVISRIDDFISNVRKDCIYIIDGPRPLCLENNSKIIRSTKPLNTIKNSIIPKMKFISGILNSSYSAGYVNWFWSIDHSTGDYMWMPPSIKALGVYLNTDNFGAYWDAPAGMNRGMIKSTLDVAFNPSNEEAGQIYINSWNYAVSYPLEGIVLEGQKTLQSDKTALDRVNVRRLMLGLEKTIRGFCKYFNYEGNTEFIRSRLTDSIERYLEQVRINDGISQYMVVCDDRNNDEYTIENNELHVTIAIRPIKTIEFIILNFVATNQSIDVSEIIASELN